MQLEPEALIAKSAVAACVSDPRQSDNPIIACNDAFLILTGYTRSEVLGRNCRFLRGPGTEPERTQQLRDAIAVHQPLMVEILNYKKDGTPFRNAVMIAPLFDAQGQIEYYLGSQIALADGGAGTSPVRQAQAAEKLEKLTMRQHQILLLMARGALNKQIAYDLGLAERTVKMHRAQVLRQLGVRSSAEAIRLAVEAGL